MPRWISPRRPTVRVALLFVLAEVFLIYAIWQVSDAVTALAVTAWTLVLIYVVVTLVSYAERARRHREQLNTRLQAEMQDSVDGAIEALAGALGLREQDASAARDAVRLVRDRYSTEDSVRPRNESP